MILAAGLGTRLGTITSDTPKALIEVGGRTLLERTVGRLAEVGCDRIIVNVHHHADQIEELHGRLPGAAHRPLWHGAHILLSREPEAPLETGGGLKRAATLFRPGHTILIHNVDVISDIDLAGLVWQHESTGARATLAVARRPASRYLVFDSKGLCGRIDAVTGREDWARPPLEDAWGGGFAGIHVVSAELVDQIEEEGAFSIVQPYLRLAATGTRILPYDVTGRMWLDVGTPERLTAARAHFDGESA